MTQQQLLPVTSCRWRVPVTPLRCCIGCSRGGSLGRSEEERACSTRLARLLVEEGGRVTEEDRRADRHETTAHTCAALHTSSLLGNRFLVRRVLKASRRA